MKIQIVEKLNRFLNENKMREEHEVVYLLVELRKLLDRERESCHKDLYSLVRFHADWSVHTRKDHITSAMEAIMTKIDDSIDTYPKNGNIDFLLLPEFRSELTQLLGEYGLPCSFCKNDDEWLKFMLALAGVLADQPIVNPTPNIAEFRYVDIKREGIMANIDFCGKRSGQSITLGFGL
ncbi:MAG: hypothetical protein M1484_04965 [Patescibacteria group bacterium]|nr:hypothetical protein [Patescibacteria group bacterium]